MPLTVLITRPEAAALQFADVIRQRLGCEVPVVLSPMMQIGFLKQDLDLTDVQVLIFTSKHGVEAFAQLSDRRDILAYAVGGGTATAAAALGLNVVTADGDATALFDRIMSDQPTGVCLHLRGEHAAGDIAATLCENGVRAVEQVVYTQQKVPLTKAAREVLQGQNPVILPLFSPRSAALVFEEVRPTAPLFVVAISQNVAEHVPEHCFERLIIADRPDADAVLKALEVLWQDAIQLEGAKRAQ